MSLLLKELLIRFLQRPRIQRRGEQIVATGSSRLSGIRLPGKGAPLENGFVSLEGFGSVSKAKSRLSARPPSTPWSPRRSRIIEALSLVIGEEEQLVLHDRTAHRAPEHVPAHVGLETSSQLF